MGLTRARNARISGAVRFDGKRPARRLRRGAARDPRRRHRDDLPGPAVLAAPLLQGRRPDRRRRSGRTATSRKAQACDRAVEMLGLVGIPEPRRRADVVPARVLRRHAPARDDRDGAGQRPEAADRRRADDRARRHGAGADPRADRAPAERVRHRGRRDHPRPRRRGRGGRRDRGDVRRPDRRARRRPTRSSTRPSTPTPGVC